MWLLGVTGQGEANVSTKYTDRPRRVASCDSNLTDTNACMPLIIVLAACRLVKAGMPFLFAQCFVGARAEHCCLRYLVNAGASNVINPTPTPARAPPLKTRSKRRNVLCDWHAPKAHGRLGARYHLWHRLPPLQGITGHRAPQVADLLLNSSRMGAKLVLLGRALFVFPSSFGLQPIEYTGV